MMDSIDKFIEDVSIDGPNDSLPLALSDFLKKDIPPLEYYVEGIIQKKGKGMISAAPNIGKSIFVQNMALDMASGNALFMNKFAVSPARVLYLDLEMGESALQERFRKMCKSRSLNTSNLFLKYIPQLDLLNDDNKEIIEQWLFDLKAEVLILDPLGNAWCGKENEQEQVRQVTSYLNTLIEKFGIAILVVHHWRKATKEFRTGGQMAAGSYVWEAWLDCHVTLEGQSSSGKTVSCHKNRNRSKFSPFLAKLNEDSLCFEYITDYQKKHDESTLERLFATFNADRVSIPELIKRAKEQKVCSETTVRKLIDEATEFRVDKIGKTHYLERKTNEIIQSALY